uniref:Uncharacterized protein n=1 Tax=Pundamilia nyererei TaxID=303518 RepID=A0A3B4HAN5_9CICH
MTDSCLSSLFSDDLKSLHKLISLRSLNSIIQRSNKETTMGIYIIKSRDANGSPEDIGIVLEGQRVWQDLDNYTLAAAMLFGLMYTLNLTYPLEKYTFEKAQVVF